MSVLNAAGVSFHFRGRGGGNILDRLDLTIEPGQFVAIMGSSGSGKSTLLQVLSGMDRPTGGRVQLTGVDLGRARGSTIKRLYRNRVSFVFQEAHLVPGLTALNNVGLAAALARVPDARQQALRWMSDLGVDAVMHQYPSELSGGQRQRVALATGLVKNPDIIFADEPTAALDTASTERIVQHFVDHAARGGSVVAVTHDRDLAQFASMVYWLEHGQLKPRPRERA